MTNQELAALVVKAQAGSRQAMNDLIAGCYQDLFYYAFQTVQNEDLAADITQDGCLDIISKLSDLREPAAFGAWARRIIHTRCSRYFRQTREVTVEEDENGETIFDRLPDESEGVLPEQVQEDKEFRKTMQQMLDSLPAEQRTALLLYYYEKRSVSQIASIQGVSDGTVKSRLNYGRKAVKNQVEAYEKKTGVRLHSLAPLPLLLYFLLAREREEVLSKCAPVLGSILGTATAAGTAAATGAVATGMGLGLKITAIVAAIAAAVGITVGGIAIAQNRSADEPKATRATMDVSVLSTLPDVWFGDEYAEGNESDVLLLQDDGTVAANGITYQVTEIQVLNGPVELQYHRRTQLWEQEGPGYRLFITSPEVVNIQLDLLTAPGCADPVAAFLYMYHQIDGDLVLAVTDTYSVTPPESGPPLPLELLTDFVGEWEYLPVDHMTFEESFTLMEDGTVIFREQTYMPENIRVDEADEYRSKTVVCEFACTSDQGYPWLGIDFVRLSDGNYAAEMSGLIPGEGSVEINHFYRPEDFSGYQKILLTAENWQDYVHYGYSYPSWTDDETGKFHAGVSITLNLAEGVAPISYFSGEVHYTATHQELLVRPDGTREQVGTKADLVTGTMEPMLVFGAESQLRLWCANPESIDNTAHKHPGIGANEQIFAGSPEDGVVIEVPVFEEIWAENVVGCVYIPAN